MEQMTNLVLMRSYFPLPQCKLLVNPVLGDFSLELRHTCVCTCMHRHMHCACAGKGCFHCQMCWQSMILHETAAFETSIFNCSDICILFTRQSLSKKIYKYTHHLWHLWCLLLVKPLSHCGKKKCNSSILQKMRLNGFFRDCLYFKCNYLRSCKLSILFCHELNARRKLISQEIWMILYF